MLNSSLEVTRQTTAAELSQAVGLQSGYPGGDTVEATEDLWSR